MTHDKDERKRPNLRLVVDNVEKRNPRSSDKEEDFIPLDELIAQRDTMRPLFYRDLDLLQAKACEELEQFLMTREWPYGLDPNGRLIIIPTGAVCPDTVEFGEYAHDEVILFVAEDATGKGLCLSMEMMLPYWSEDETIMEETLLYAPVFQYGALFLEENRQDGLLDLIYRLGFPLYPPAPTDKLLDRLFSIASYELAETLKCLAEYPEA